ncbi:MAG: hypothetical protein AAGA86_13055 [Bacteroidota bacterium]
MDKHIGPILIGKWYENIFSPGVVDRAIVGDLWEASGLGIIGYHIREMEFPKGVRYLYEFWERYGRYLAGTRP